MGIELNDQLERHARMPAWTYTGPLEEGKAAVWAMCQEVKEFKKAGISYVSTRQDARGGEPAQSVTTSADSFEDAWRGHIGLLFSVSAPHPDDAEPGETVTEYRRRLGV